MQLSWLLHYHLDILQQLENSFDGFGASCNTVLFVFVPFCLLLVPAVWKDSKKEEQRCIICFAIKTEIAWVCGDGVGVGFLEDAGRFSEGKGCKLDGGLSVVVCAYVAKAKYFLFVDCACMTEV